MNQIDNRKTDLLNRREIVLAVEGKYTNIRIWASGEGNGCKFKPISAIYMRLDKYFAYSVPLSIKTYSYLDKECLEIKELLQFDFPTPITNLDKILAITAALNSRQLLPW